MPFDSFFAASTKVSIDRKPGLPPRMEMSDEERERLIVWVENLPQPIGGWQVSFDATYGSGSWPGRKPGRRLTRRDMLVSNRRRGFDPDDALDCFRKFMDRCAHGVTWFASVEPNPDFSGLNPGHHIHAALAGCETLRRNKLAALWLGENGICKVRPIKSRRAAICYFTKHLVRRGCSYSWKINSSELWHRIVAEQTPERDLPPDQPRAARPFGWRKGRSVSQLHGRTGLPLPGMSAA